MANKTTLQRLRLDPYFNKTIDTNLNVWSHDQNSYEIKFEFYDHQCNKPIDLTGADMRILLDHADNKPKIYPLEIESKVLGLAKFIMPEQIRGCEGKFTAHIYADYPNKTHDFGSFTFYTQLSRIDGETSGCMDEIYVSEFEKALKEIKDKSAQFGVVEKRLTERVEKIEADIQSKEIVKKNEFEKLNDDFKKMNIGGENIVLDSKGPFSTADGTESFKLEVPIEPGEYVISFELDLKNGSPGTQSRIGVDCIGVMENGKNLYLGAWHNLSDGTDFNGVVTGTNYIPSKITRINTAKVYDTLIEADKKEITKIRIQRGNRDGGWSRSPGDLQKQIDELNKAITNLGGTL